jgi:hypothetical protein
MRAASMRPKNLFSETWAGSGSQAKTCQADACQAGCDVDVSELFYDGERNNARASGLVCPWWRSPTKSGWLTPHFGADSCSAPDASPARSGPQR